MQHFYINDITSMEQRFRARFINSLSGFKSANLLGTVSSDGITNLSIVSSAFHIGANPALLGVIIRPDSVPRDSLSNIKQTNYFTVNHVSSMIWQQAHQCSARYPATESEFDSVGLTPEFIDEIAAPFVAESQLKFALKLRQVIPLEINGTVLVIGEIIHVVCPATSVQQDGYIDIESLDTVAVSGLDSYHTTDRLSRLAYAKPELPSAFLDVSGEEIALQRKVASE
jgi:flavin reductase (DIM6/NTAB) family NADH-FMN oxidoreductase RutF